MNKHSIIRFLHKHKHWLLILLLLCVYMFACRKNVAYEPIPVLSTAPVTLITPTSAVSGGSIISDAGAAISTRGVCYSTNTSPTITDHITMNDAGTGSYTSELKNLIPNTTYYVRAYAINFNGTGYGETISFTTLPEQVPLLVTLPVKEIGLSTAVFSGTILSTGGATLDETGFCWDTDSLPTIGQAKIKSVVLNDQVNSNMKGLQPATKYFVRIYATTRLGTAYGNTVSFSTIQQPPGTITDIDNNIYHTLNIGAQQWLAENLKTTKLNDGTLISYISDKTEWTNTAKPGYVWYSNNEAASKDLYGGLYNWYTVNSGKLCPVNWHIPSDEEWTALADFLDPNAGSKLKEKGNLHWNKPNTDATNESGFTALPGGYRNNTGIYYYIGSTGYWWSSTERDPGKAWARDLNNSGAALYSIGTYKNSGFSVRCIHD